MQILVIVATYNRPYAIKKLINVLLAQTKLPSEIIIASGRSSQVTQKLINDLTISSTLCPIVHIWHAENKRDRLEINDTLLKKQIGSKQFVCQNGIENKIDLKE
jgi:glycosyltransferase involved in cell wall biosynthesis